MSKLSPAVKALINAQHARPHAMPVPANIASVYQQIKSEAQKRQLTPASWLALSTAATVTMNSPASLRVLYQVATHETDTPIEHATATAEFMRETGLKCMSIIGIPRVINCLNEFRNQLPETVGARLVTKPTREYHPDNVEGIKARGLDLWNSIYRPFEKKLIDKLARSHPDMPVIILQNNYAALLSNPEETSSTDVKGRRVGRLATSMMAIACLRAQTGCAPQVLSHIFGIRKALEDGTWAQDAESQAGASWLASDEGNLWILQSVDSIVEAIGQGHGTSFAPPGPRSKL